MKENIKHSPNNSENTLNIQTPTPEKKLEDSIDELFTQFKDWDLDNERKNYVREASSGTPISTIAAVPSKDRAKMEEYLEYYRNLTPKGWNVSMNGMQIIITMDKYSRGPESYNSEYDNTPNQPSMEVNEGTASFDYTPYMASILEYMIDEGMKIIPLPEIKIKKDSTEAGNFFGKTAYYSPIDREVVLFTEGRHPKDVMRSFAHEMIHHIQNLEERLTNIKTQNTNEDDYLKEIEKEAYLLGNITFRNWEDKVKKELQEDKDGKKAFTREVQMNENITQSELNAIEFYADKLFAKLGIDIEFTRHFLDRVNDERNKKPITVAELIGIFKRLYKKHGKPLSKTDDDFEAVVKDFNNDINIPFAINVTPDDIEMYAKTIMRKKDFKTSTPVYTLQEGRYDALANRLSKIAFEAFKDIHDRGDSQGTFNFRVDNPDDEHDIPSKEFYFDFEGVVEITDDEYVVDGAANAGVDKKGEDVTPLLVVKFKIPKNPDWQKVSFDIKDVVRHELEHLTQDRENVKPGKQMDDDQAIRDLIDLDLVPKADYFRLPKEIDAMLQGLYFKAKKSKRPYREVIDDYLATQPIDAEEKENILTIWRERNKSLNLPKF